MDEIHIKKLRQCLGFNWDNANTDKNWLKHKVSPAECEQVFFNRPLVVEDDIAHSKTEQRFYALGQTDSKRTIIHCFHSKKKSYSSHIGQRHVSRKEREVYKNE